MEKNKKIENILTNLGEMRLLSMAEELHLMSSRNELIELSAEEILERLTSLAYSILDRILPNAYKLVISGDSMRK